MPPRLPRRRKQLGLTQDELAAALGFADGNHVSKTERGLTPIMPRTVRQMEALVQGDRPPVIP